MRPGDNSRRLGHVGWAQGAPEQIDKPAHPRQWAELMPPFADPGAALPNKSYTKTRISGQTRGQRANPAVGVWNAEGRRNVLIIVVVLLHGLDKELNPKR
jgi:hypothetical protein